MTITIVGIQRIDFKNDKGERIAGKKLHCVVEDEQGADVRGKVTKTLFISENAAYQADNAVVGKHTQHTVSPVKGSCRSDRSKMIVKEGIGMKKRYRLCLWPCL